VNDGTPPTAWTPDGETPMGETGKLPDEDTLIEAIATVYDPEIPVNIYELGLIYAVEIDDDGGVKVEMTLTAPAIDDDGGVKVEMTLTAPACPSAQELPEQVQNAVLTVPGVTSCHVETVWDPPWDPSRMTEEARLQLNMF
jgi:metal-sulfur cluster biosynthetic enzyme